MRPPPARRNANPNGRIQIASEGEDGVGIITPGPGRAAPAHTVHRPATGRGGFDLDACSPAAAAVASGTGTEALVSSSVVPFILWVTRARRQVVSSVFVSFFHIFT